MNRPDEMRSALAVGSARPHLAGPVGPSLVTRVLLGLIRFYQAAISPWLGRACRFEPSCSRYAAGCLEAHGALRGSLLSVKRLCKCCPFHPGGYDPPPA
jgi:uncharacterized protein